MARPIPAVVIVVLAVIAAGYGSFGAPAMSNSHGANDNGSSAANASDTQTTTASTTTTTSDASTTNEQTATTSSTTDADSTTPTTTETSPTTTETTSSGSGSGDDGSDADQSEQPDVEFPSCTEVRIDGLEDSAWELEHASVSVWLLDDWTRDGPPPIDTHMTGLPQNDTGPVYSYDGDELARGNLYVVDGVTLVSPDGEHAEYENPHDCEFVVGVQDNGTVTQPRDDS